jgi:hypothetical protein
MANASDLPKELSDTEVSLLVMPYGSAFPEDNWQTIYQFLQRGGNLLTLGGRPFTRPVYRNNGAWQARAETYAFARELLISDYQAVGASAGMKQMTNSDQADDELPTLDWRHAYSVVIRLSDEASSPRIGGSGTPDSQLNTLQWGIREGHKLAAPIIQVDHFRNDYVGSRWIMVNCDPGRPDGFSSHLISRLAKLATVGATLFTVTPTFPLYLPAESPSFALEWSRFEAPQAVASKLTAELVVSSDDRKEFDRIFDLVERQPLLHNELSLNSSFTPGFHTVVVTLRIGTQTYGIYRTGFWVRDEAYLASGPRVSVDHEYFQLDGKQLPVVGTTYMDSKSQRLFLRYPNPYVWDQDMRQISQDGLNMLRTGLWTDWDQATGNTGIASEHTLRTIEAFLMTARKYNLPVQFNLFAFMPEVFGGGNAYLDPEALRREHAFVSSVVARFQSVPFLIWDLINEPSFDNPNRFFGTKPNGDAVESADWNEWLLAHYRSREEIDSLWKTALPRGRIPVPDEQDFSGRGDRSLSVYDFNLFTQEKFAAWANGMRQTIRDTGSKQLITVGTDEGGGLGSVSPAFFKTAVDFTTMHSWWLYDDLLWDSLVAKQPGMPLLVQETGVMFEPDLQGRPRRTLENEAALLERKVGIALGTDAGAIEWLWNINSLMQSQQEVTIGAIRWDGTEKPETEVLKAYGHFVAAARDHFRNSETESVAILTSQALQYSPFSNLAIVSQQRAARVMNYQCRIPARIVSEDNVGDIVNSKLVVLPSPQALSESTWKALLAYVDRGGNLLITGPVERNEHWQRTHRLSDLGIDAEASALNYRGAEIDMGNSRVELGFGIDIQKHAEALHLNDGKSYLEVKRGSGTIFLVTYPVELAESPDATESVYRHVLSVAEIDPPFKVNTPSPSILIRPRFFEDSTLYLLVSESSLDTTLDIRDKRSGAQLEFTLPAQRTKLVLIDKKTGTVLSSFDPPDLSKR